MEVRLGQKSEIMLLLGCVFMCILAIVIAFAVDPYIGTSPVFKGDIVATAETTPDGVLTLLIKSSSLVTGAHQMDSGSYSISGFKCIQGGTLFLNGHYINCVGANGETDCSTAQPLVIPSSPDNILLVSGGSSGTHPIPCTNVAGEFGAEIKLTPSSR